MSRYALAPSRILLIVLLLSLAVCALASWYALHEPWLGLTLIPDKNGVLVEKSSGPSRTIPAGARLLKLGTAPSHMDLRSDDLIEEPDSFDTYPLMDEFFQRQSVLHVLLQSPVRLAWQKAGGPEQQLTLTPGIRPLSDLPAVFWFQLFAGTTGCLIGCWVWVLRPHDWGTRMFALTGLMFPLFTLPAAIYSTRELALHGKTFQLLSSLNHTGALLFGCALAGIFLTYPRMLVKPRHLLWLPLVFGAFLLADLFRLAPNQDWGYRIPVMAEMTLAIGFGVVQWMKSRSQPIDRAALRWLMLSALIGCGLFVFTTAGSGLFGLMHPLSQGYSFGFFLIMYVGIALGLRRYRLFELDEWAYRILLWVGGAMIVIALDAAFILILGLNPTFSMGITLLAGGLLYFPLRQWLWQRYVAPAHFTMEQVMPDLIRIAFLSAARERNQQWTQLLQTLYDPLEVSSLESAPSTAELADDGLSLRVPSCGGLQACQLRYPYLGHRLFSSHDAVLVNSLCQLMNHATAGREAYETGAAEERRRIARDMHDDVGARLLMLIHRTHGGPEAEIARAAMRDLRTAISTMDARPMLLADALADWRAETTSRIEAAGALVQWHEPEQLPQIDLSSSERSALERVLREAVSNALKHASPCNIEIDVSLDEALRISVSNDGFAPPPHTWAQGRGLRNMRARLAELGGNLSIEAQNNHPRLLLTLPLAR